MKIKRSSRVLAAIERLEDRLQLSSTTPPFFALPTGNIPNVRVTVDGQGDINAEAPLPDLNSGGTFGPLTYAPDAVATGDFTGSGVSDDFVVAQTTEELSKTGDNYVTVILGNGDGTFQSTVPRPNVPFRNPSIEVGNQPTSIAVGDFNNDNKPDIVVANYGSNTLSVLIGNGDGYFQPAETLADGPAPVSGNRGYAPISVAVGDFNGDNNLDIVAANYATGTLSIFYGNGDGTFQSPQIINLNEGALSSVAVGDLNGHADIVAGSASQDTVTVLLGNGDGTFQSPQTYSLGAAGSYVNSLILADVNGDGQLDVVTANNTLATPAGSATVSVLLNNGNGTFAPAENYLASNGPVSGVAVVEVDGKPDVVTAQRLHPGQTTPYIATQFTISGQKPNTSEWTAYFTVNSTNNDLLSVLAGNGDGTFKSGETMQDPVSGANVSGFALGNFNGSGQPSDLLMVGAIQSQLATTPATTIPAIGGETYQAVSLSSLSNLAALVSQSKATQLSFARQPLATTDGQPMTPIVVDLMTPFNAIDTGSDGNVTLSIKSGPPGATLSGTLTVRAVNGIATFNDVIVSTPGRYKFYATHGALPSAISVKFFATAPVSATPQAEVASPALETSTDVDLADNSPLLGEPPADGLN